MNILALEFSTLRRSVALLVNGQLVREEEEEARRGGSPFPLIARVLGEFQRGDIAAIAIGLGPGSYTGIRSALAIAQGWNLSLGVNAIGVSSADAIAFQAAELGVRGRVEVAIDAQRNELYSALYDISGQLFLLQEPLAIRPAPHGEDAQLIGPDAKRWNPNALEIFPKARAVAILAQKKSPVSPENLEAIYLREISFVKAPPPRRL